MQRLRSPQVHGQSADFRLPHEYGEAGAWGGPAEPPVPLGPPLSAVAAPPPKKPKLGMHAMPCGAWRQY